MPLIGFGTAGLGEATAVAVAWALQAGYRLIDTAQVCNPLISPRNLEEKSLAAPGETVSDSHQNPASQTDSV